MAQGQPYKKMELSGSRHNRRASPVVTRRKERRQEHEAAPHGGALPPTQHRQQGHTLGFPELWPFLTIKSCFRFPNAFKRILCRESCSLKSYSSTFPTLARQRGTQEFCYQKIITSPGHYQAQNAAVPLILWVQLPPHSPCSHLPSSCL